MAANISLSDENFPEKFKSENFPEKFKSENFPEKISRKFSLFHSDS
jgi:hypothetical protein